MDGLMPLSRSHDRIGELLSGSSAVDKAGMDARR